VDVEGVHHAPAALSPRRENFFPLNIRQGGHQSRSDTLEGGKHFACWENRTTISRPTNP
jgi:hypothetical protein